VDKIYCTLAPVEEATTPDELARLVRSGGGSAEVFQRPEEALSRALADRTEGEIVLVAGSLFLVAAGREFLMNQEMKRS
jgi:dihydrofolate synthase/folylpolyglutamate synthase